MRTQFGAWRATYTTGDWLALSGPNCMVLMPPAPPSASGMLGEIWNDLLDNRAITEVAAKLTNWGMDELPNLAVFFFADGALHCLLRGQVGVVEADSGELLASGVGAKTWYETRLDSRRVYIAVQQVDAESLLQLPLVLGAAQVSSVLLDAMDVEIQFNVGPSVALPSLAEEAEAQQATEAEAQVSSSGDSDETQLQVAEAEAVQPDVEPEDEAELEAGQDAEQDGDEDAAGQIDQLTAVDDADEAATTAKVPSAPAAAAVAGGAAVVGGATAAAAAPIVVREAAIAAISRKSRPEANLADEPAVDEAQAPESTRPRVDEPGAQADEASAQATDDAVAESGALIADEVAAGSAGLIDNAADDESTELTTVEAIDESAELATDESGELANDEASEAATAEVSEESAELATEEETGQDTDEQAAPALEEQTDLATDTSEQTGRSDEQLADESAELAAQSTVAETEAATESSFADDQEASDTADVDLAAAATSDPQEGSSRDDGSSERTIDNAAAQAESVQPSSVDEATTDVAETAAPEVAQRPDAAAQAEQTAAQDAANSPEPAAGAEQTAAQDAAQPVEQARPTPSRDDLAATLASIWGGDDSTDDQSEAVADDEEEVSTAQDRDDRADDEASSEAFIADQEVAVSSGNAQAAASGASLWGDESPAEAIDEPADAAALPEVEPLAEPTDQPVAPVVVDQSEQAAAQGRIAPDRDERSAPQLVEPQPSPAGQAADEAVDGRADQVVSQAAAAQAEQHDPAGQSAMDLDDSTEEMTAVRKPRLQGQNPASEQFTADPGAGFEDDLEQPQEVQWPAQGQQPEPTQVLPDRPPYAAGQEPQQEPQPEPQVAPAAATMSAQAASSRARGRGWQGALRRAAQRAEQPAVEPEPSSQASYPAQDDDYQMPNQPTVDQRQSGSSAAVDQSAYRVDQSDYRASGQQAAEATQMIAGVPEAYRVDAPAPADRRDWRQERPKTRPNSVSEDNDGETIFTTGIAATHKPAESSRADDSLVLAAMCAYGHPNQPGSTSCRICGSNVDSHNPQLTSAPVLANVQLADGRAYQLVRPLIVGRAPTRGERDVDAELVKVESPNQDVSRNHVRIFAKGWNIQVTDLNSTNGTMIALPGAEPVELAANSMTVPIGTTIDLGDGQVVTLTSPNGNQPGVY